jgi:hypothetical protein
MPASPSDLNENKQVVADLDDFRHYEVKIENVTNRYIYIYDS